MIESLKIINFKKIYFTLKLPRDGEDSYFHWSIFLDRHFYSIRFWLVQYFAWSRPAPVGWPQHHFAHLPVFELSQNREFFRFLGIREGLIWLVICLTKIFVYKNTLQAWLQGGGYNKRVGGQNKKKDGPFKHPLPEPEKRPYRSALVGPYNHLHLY